MFSGSHALSVDDKGRIAVPARLRQHMADHHATAQVYMVSIEGHVEIYPAPQYFALVEQIRNLEDRAAAEILKDAYIGGAVDAEFDKQGRITLPTLHRQDSDITGRAYLVGMDTRLDLWSEAAHEARRQQQKQQLPDVLHMLKR